METTPVHIEQYSSHPNYGVNTGKRNIRDGHEFERFFPGRSKGDYITIKKDGAQTLTDTIPLMKKVIRETLKDTKKIAKHLQAESALKTCKRIWDFCFHHFQYTKDEQGKEQIRRPIRSWFDRIAGIDCDCFTVLIGSMLSHLNIPYVMRLTYYRGEQDYSHIYPVAYTPEGEEIIIDCVVHQFNYEVPYEGKRDETMELQYLNGVETDFSDDVMLSFDNNMNIDAQDLFADDLELMGLEGKAERKAKKAKRKAKREKRRETPLKERVKEKLKKGLNVINKVNPATALLRAGVLAAMKLNVMKIASTLRFAYWSQAEARKNNMDMAKFNQLQRIREKIEKIYYGAGGKTEALKKAILSGKGNRNRMVQLNGLGAIIPQVGDEDDLRTILGDELFFEELDGADGLSGLGAAATGAAIGAASGILAAIRRLIQKLGSLFKKGSLSEQKFKIQDNTDNQEEGTRLFSVRNLINKVKTRIQERKHGKLWEPGTGTSTANNTPIPDTTEDTENIPIIPPDEFLEPETEPEFTSRAAEDEPNEEPGKLKKWIQENKNLAIGLGIGTGVVGIGLTAYLVNRSKKKKGLNGLEGIEGVEGTPKKKTKAKTKKTIRKKTTTTRKRKPTIRKKRTKKYVPKSRKRKTTATKKKTIPKVALL